jgi:predicted TIM-barrel fold metal-dependent hydrolase
MSCAEGRLSRRAFLAGAATVVAAAAHTVPVRAKQNGRLIVDAQVHVWLPSTPDRPWPNKDAKPQMPDPFTIERLIPRMDEAGVDRVVLIPPSWHGAKLGNAYCQSAAKAYPGRFGVMGLGVALDQPDGAKLIPGWRDQPGFLGLRIGMNRAAITSGTGEWFFSAAEKAGVPICFLASGVNGLLGSVAEKHPGLPMIVDHMGVSEAFMTANPHTWQDEVAVVAGLARFPNVSVKLSSIPFFSSQPYPWRDTFPLIQRCFDAFGPLRCHWGTDQTHSYEKATYRLRIAQFTEELTFLTENDKDWIMGRSLLARLRWA